MYSTECSGSEEIEGRWEAARSLHAWFRHLVEMNDASEILTGATHAVTEQFLISEEEIRIAIEQGFLERPGNSRVEAVFRILVHRRKAPRDMESCFKVG